MPKIIEIDQNTKPDKRKISVSFYLSWRKYKKGLVIIGIFSFLIFLLSMFIYSKTGFMWFWINIFIIPSISFTISHITKVPISEFDEETMKVLSRLGLSSISKNAGTISWYGLIYILFLILTSLLFMYEVIPIWRVQDFLGL